MHKVWSMIRAAWQLFVYLLIGLNTLIVLSPTAYWINKNHYVWLVWIWFDRIVCFIAHFKWKRTISGLTGERMHKHDRYYFQALVIDFLASLFGDKPKHCYRAYLWERRKGYTK